MNKRLGRLPNPHRGIVSAASNSLGRDTTRCSQSYIFNMLRRVAEGISVRGDALLIILSNKIVIMFLNFNRLSQYTECFNVISKFYIYSFRIFRFF